MHPGNPYVKPLSPPIPTYNKAVPNTQQQGFSSIYRNSEQIEGLLLTPDPKWTTLKSLYIHLFTEQYASRPYLARIAVTGQEHREITDTLTYAQGFQKAVQIGSGLLKENLCRIDEQAGLSLIGVYCKNRPQFYLLDVASILYGLTTVPFYDTLGQESLSYCFGHSGVKACFCSIENGFKLLKLGNVWELKTLIILDVMSQGERSALEKIFRVMTFEELIQIGASNQVDYHTISCQGDQCMTFCYTSGTTGPPKAAMLTHINFLSFLAAFKELLKEYTPPEHQVHLSMLPLAHAYQRIVVLHFTAQGSLIVPASGNILKIREDIALVRPTELVSVPRIYNRILEVIMTKVGGEQQLRNIIHENGQTLMKIRESLGGRLTFLLTGSAPIVDKNKELLELLFGCPCIEGYGQTENTGGAFMTKMYDTNYGHVGTVMANLEFKLQDISEMGYLTSDCDSQGRSTPRGELWLRGNGVIKGYYKSPEITKEAITEDGWLKTGDVAVLLPIGLKVIDRKKNIFKLSQGEYVACEKVEAIYCRSPYVSECFLHGESLKDFAVSIIVGNRGNIQALHPQMDYATICRDPSIRKIILNDLNSLGRSKGLKGFQQARNIRIETESFVARGTVSTTMKLQRFIARRVYASEIAEMYEQGMIPME